MCDLKKNINFDCAEDNDTFNEDVNHSFDVDLTDFPEVLAFIRRLQDCIIRQRKIILQFYEKIHNEVVQVPAKKLSDASTQTYNDDFVQKTEIISNESVADITGSIVDQVKEIAETAVRQTGFVYEASSGMYYDYNTGYYYNAELGLYYDGNSGNYLTYDEASKTFNYHSSVVKKDIGSYSSKDEDVTDSNEEAIDGPKGKCLKEDENVEMDAEEGECSDDDKAENRDVKEGDVSINKIDHDSKTDVNVVSAFSHLADSSSLINLDEIANGWPPCMRIVVQETGLDNLTVGTLFIVTCNGGTLGREGDHSVIIPDITISKHHASFTFSEEKKCYTVVDLGSRNGTFLNGNRLSVALQESPPHPIEHGYILRVGSTHLLCHIHDGTETCKQCEPGCMVPHKLDKGEALNDSRLVKHRSELRRLRRKFGLEGPGSGLRIMSENSGNYQDRAEARRKAVGSSDDSEKTEVASVFQSIKSDNKGFKMMSKMGWTKGQALGKDSNSDGAITEPILVEQRPERAGLGSLEASLPNVELSSDTVRKSTIWKKTLKRYHQPSS